jgi:hypothetical protein
MDISSKKVKVIEIKTGKCVIYESQSAVVRHLKIAQNTIVDIMKNRRSNEYKGYKFEKVN